MPNRALVVCCDGTWNTPDQEDGGVPSPTNVVRLYNCLVEQTDTRKQLRYYHPGVGTEGGLLTRTAGGAYGKGLGQNILSAYRWLGSRYEPGDDVYLFGFSRGAFTVRSLAGMVAACGLLDLREEDIDEQWERVGYAYERCYRVDPDDRPDLEAKKRWALHRPVKIRFIGVWDTVGALGIPDDLAILNLLDKPENWRFHDASLGDDVVTARHAVALDEQRASFAPTLWEEKPGRDVAQVWFPGVHSDVGGGYGDNRLADGALAWMIREAKAADLVFDDDMVAQLKADERGTLHDSVRGVFKGLRTRPRAVPYLLDENAPIDDSATNRHRTPPITQAPYRPSSRLAEGESVKVTVYARERWNDTGVYLPPGKYAFDAVGTWLDASIECGPGGTSDGHFQPAEILHMAGSAWGLVERAWKRVTKNDQADFWFTRRVEDAPWFALIGVVANDSGDRNPDNDGSPSPHERFLIGDGCEHTIERGGYFYAFANDAWSKYENNRGGIKLTIKRLGPGD
ncbi:MAG: DUF2235 domain-containing protein [Planctomycetota bacterium]|jgi:hypothetical protein